ncbi:MAG: HEAT repeat domain-containing protein, partial [Myxococcota bacterium]
MRRFHFNRPSDGLRQRATAAIADVGDQATIAFLVSLLDEPDPIIREHAARGLATACRPDNLAPLVDALAHGDLPVRSWAAEGLARMGDVRAGPVLVGTLDHEHRPLREGAIVGLVALGPDGIRGLLQGLQDDDRTLQDLALAVIVARDVALARVNLAPDLLLTALAAEHPEIRYAAARVLETRDAGTELNGVAKRLVGPTPPEKAADAKDWPEENTQSALLNVLVSALASDDPTQRYAAARVLSRRGQPKAFWREAERLARPSRQDEPWIPSTSWDDEVIQPRKKDWVRRILRAAPVPPAEESKVKTWVRRLFTGGRGEQPFGTPPTASTGAPYRADVLRMVFGTYAGLVRQSPPPGDTDETHRVRRDSVARLGALAKEAEVGQGAVLPVLRRALSDPHHLVRKKAVQALADVYPEGSLEPLGLALACSSDDIGQAAVAELVARAERGDTEARTRALAAIDAPAPAVRANALGRLPRLFGQGSLEPWFLALRSKYADVRLAVVERLIDSDDERVFDALNHALESDHEDLRLKAALALAKRGDLRTLDVLAGFLLAEGRPAEQALAALVELPRAHAPGHEAAARVAQVVATRLEDDPDQTAAVADRPALINALGELKSPAGVPALLAAILDDDASIR